MQKPNTSKIILGSSSRYRKDLLDRILDTYEIISPKIDENNYNSLCAQKHSQQIALKKIAHIAENKIDSLIICADQIGEIGNKTLTKPTSRKNALNQLINYSNSLYLLDFKVCINTYIKTFIIIWRVNKSEYKSK